MKSQVILLLSAGFLAVPLADARACWTGIEPAAFAGRCPVVITGTITKIEAGPAGNADEYDLAHITISAVHKNALKDLLLAKGSVLPVCMAARAARVRNSTDLRYPLGDKALWLIDLRPDGSFSLNIHPVQRQPIGTEKKVMSREVVVLKKGGSPAATHTLAEWIAEQKAGGADRKDVKRGQREKRPR